MYDKNNIFAKILRGEIPSLKLYEDDMLVVIQDANPAAPIHLLVLPKGEYSDFSDFVSKAHNEEISHYFKIVAKIAKENGADDYRIICNKGHSAGQSVFHFHTHILSGFKNINLLDEAL